MRTVAALVQLQRSAPRDPGRWRPTPALLAVVAFAVTTALGLSVIGGLRGFLRRAAEPTTSFMADQGDAYVILAWIAVVLLIVPLLSLGAAAGRLGVARRDARLATLRLLGATPREVVGLTVLETAGQGLRGAAAGVVGYGLLLPLWTTIPFQGRAFGPGEMWVGLPTVALTLVVVPLLAAVSAAASLRRVVVSPLGVARRVTPPGMRWLRALAVVAAVGAFTAVARLGGRLEAAVGILLLLAMLAAVLGTLNLLGPWTITVLGRISVRRATTPVRLLVARRLLDDPRGAWRVVGGLGLASFVAAVLSVLPALTTLSGEEDAATRMLVDDVVTGGMLTLGIAFVLAASSAGVLQAASVLDRRREYALQRLAGVPVELFDRVRRREVLLPLVFVAGTSAAVGLVVLLPLFGVALATDPSGLLTLLACLVVGVLLVLGATEASRPVLRSVLAETVVRAD